MGRREPAAAKGFVSWHIASCLGKVLATRPWRKLGDPRGPERWDVPMSELLSSVEIPSPSMGECQSEMRPATPSPNRPAASARERRRLDADGRAEP